MLGDQTQPADSDGARNGAPSGPRHAAPRKSLLIKLHVPAGKAVALAAMPTAVLMGMGFTPHLAQADEMPKSKFKAGPCVSQTDTPTATPSPSSSASAAGKDTSTGGSGGKATPSPSASPSVSPSPKADSPDSPLKKVLPKPATTTAAPKPSASPSPAAGSTGTSGTTSSAPSSSSTTNPLDPLGLGNLLGGLLGTDKSAPAPSPSPTTPSPSPSPTKSAPAPSASPSPSAPAKSSPDSGTSATPKATPKQTGKSPADALSKTVKDLAGTSPTATPKATPTGSTAASGGSGYPCPTYDAKALSDAQVEGGIPLLPDDPWTLKSSKLTLHGLQYDGIVQVRTWSGTVKDVLKFTATGIDIDDLWQTVNGPNGGHTFVKAAPGSTSTIRNGTVTMYTESLSGNLLGLIPITFTPKAPPPLTLPELFFTHVTVVQAGQFGGDLHVPGMQVLPGRP